MRAYMAALLTLILVALPSPAGSLTDEYGTTAKVRQEIDAHIEKCCLFLACGQPDQARFHENIARESWRAYQEYMEASAQGRISRRPSSQPSFHEIERDVVRDILAGKRPFAAELIAPLREALSTAKDILAEEAEVPDPLAPPVPPNEPVPD